MLIGIVWMPVTAYRSSRETRACARVTIASVRAVPVVEREPEEPSVGVEQCVVDPPRVDPDAGEACPAGRAPESEQRLLEQLEQIPVQAVG